MMSMQGTRFEIAARARKVSELVTTARARGITANQILDLETGESDQSALMMLEADMLRRLPTSRPPSTTTWMVARAALEALERLDAAESIVSECGCNRLECCVACCAFPKCSNCAKVAS